MTGVLGRRPIFLVNPPRDSHQLRISRNGRCSAFAHLTALASIHRAHSPVVMVASRQYDAETIAILRRALNALKGTIDVSRRPRVPVTSNAYLIAYEKKHVETPKTGAGASTAVTPMASRKAKPIILCVSGLWLVGCARSGRSVRTHPTTCRFANRVSEYQRRQSMGVNRNPRRSISSPSRRHIA